MVIRVAGVVLPNNKHINIALCNIFGIGKYRANIICDKIKVDPYVKIENLSNEHLILLQEAVNIFEIESNLYRSISANIKRLSDINSYRGVRHKKFLPVNGQRTKTNAKTRKKLKKRIN